MLEDIKCKKLIAIFQDDKLMLEGSKKLEFTVDKNVSISIEQLGIRIITVISKQEISFNDLYGIFTKIERLLMLFDGRFIKLKELNFEGSVEKESEHLTSYSNNIMNSRLAYYRSADFCDYTLNKLIDYENVLTTEIFSSWEDILDELDIVHQMFLYSVSDSKMPVDVKCAFLIELAEPLVEIVKKNTRFYSSLNPGKSGTTLKMCIDALISKYGTDIFDKEINNNYEKISQVIVNSRVRIMHIKRRQKGLYFNGSESILYAQKISVLYRRIVFEMLGIDNELYADKMKVLIESLDGWNGVQERFFEKIK